MKYKHIHKSTFLRFKRWSRKAYAVFASLGKVVNIGRLAVGIAEASERKTSPAGYQEIHIFDIQGNSSEDDLFGLNTEPSLLLISQKTEISTLINQKNEVALKVAQKYIIKTAGRV